VISVIELRYVIPVGWLVVVLNCYVLSASVNGIKDMTNKQTKALIQDIRQWLYDYEKSQPVILGERIMTELENKANLLFSKTLDELVT
jgi:hypothetical protein